jgi:hypothetical protein
MKIIRFISEHQDMFYDVYSISDIIGTLTNQVIAET